MSFVRKMFSKPSVKKTASIGNCDCSKDVIVDDSAFDDEEVDLIDVFRIENRLVVRKEDLNTKFRKVAKQEKKMCRLQKHLIQMDRELVELRRMLRQTDLQKNALEAEVECKREELKDTTCLVQMDFEVDVKKKEPLLYKKYNGIKTTADAKSLLGSIKNKQKALQHLEILTFKKYLSTQHELQKDTVQKTSKDNPDTLNVPPKKPKHATFPTRFGLASDGFFNPFGTSSILMGSGFGHPLFRPLYGQHEPTSVELHAQDQPPSSDIDGDDLNESDGIDGGFVSPVLETEIE